MKAKFTELENTVNALTTLKDEMAKQKDHQDREKQLFRETLRQRQEMLRAKKQADQQIHAYYSAQPLKEYRPELSNQPNNLDHFKRREVMQEQNMLFSEGVDRYEHKKYTQAKLLFGELADQHDRRAEAWLKKVDRAITQQLLNSEESEASERTAFTADQLKAQRELIVIQERERQRQKKLTEELERQKRLYEDDRLLQFRKKETMKVQERERQRQEEKRLRLEEENEKKQEMLRFHKIKTVAQVQPAVVVPAVPQPKTVAPPVASAPPATAAVAVKPPALTAKQQQEQARQARIKAKAEARQKREEERQKEREHQKELRAQREAERQAKIKAAADAKAALAKAQAEKSAQEEKRKEEVLRQQEQKREEKIKQEEIIREEAQRQEEMERQERQRQAQLEAQREAVRKQLEDGVEAMYQDALNLYQQGNYTAAADRFKDVQDIIPGYKRSEQYMDEAHQKSLTVKPQAESPQMHLRVRQMSALPTVAVRIITGIPSGQCFQSIRFI